MSLRVSWRWVPQEQLLFLVSPVLVLIAWAWISQLGVFPEQILVPPQHVWEAGLELWESGELQLHLKQSLHRLALGFWVGALLGMGFGILMGLSRTVEHTCSPFFNAIRQVPTVAFIPMLILIFGVEETFKIVVVAKAAFFPISLATHDAVKGIPATYFEVARAYRLPTRLLVWRIILPYTIPPVLTGFRLSLGRSWMVLVAAELLAADSGVGQMMEMGRQMFRIDIVMVGVFVTGLIGFSLDRGFRGMESRLVKWKYQ
jgi:sulfonate transport system permease protein